MRLIYNVLILPLNILVFLLFVLYMVTAFPLAFVSFGICKGLGATSSYGKSNFSYHWIVYTG